MASGAGIVGLWGASPRIGTVNLINRLRDDAREGSFRPPRAVIEPTPAPQPRTRIISAAKPRTWTVIGLTAPAYLWLAVTVLLPLSAMLFFSFLTVAPFGLETPALTFANYLDFIHQDFLHTLTERSLML